MPNEILPGIYITVRDEGLIAAGGVSTGNIGVVGTADNKNPGELKFGEVFSLSNFTAAKEAFGSETGPSNSSLLKSLELIFANGGSTVYAVPVKEETPDKYAEGLAKLENEFVNIVLLAGQDISKTEMVEKLSAHLKITAETKHERIGIIGCGESADAKTIANAAKEVVDDTGRIIYVAPGISLKRRDPATGTESQETLSGAYTAAAVAGLLASLPVQSSPTNKTLNISGLATQFNQAQLEALVKENVLAIEYREGFRVVKGVTTSSNAAWSQITTRRIVDYALYGVRSACLPYIGKLNNARVRSAMKATLDGFLRRMVESESLVGYTLDVNATREQEIGGKAIVNMTMQPTFSIDYIMVTMTLG